MRAMKIIALMPVKNEGWILDYTLTCLKDFVDEIIVLENDSIDNTPDILEKHDVTVINKTFSAFGSRRKELLHVGREHGGTHFVFLDADEIFTADLRKDFRDLLKKMKPGQKMMLRWLTMWKSPFVYRNDNSVWSNNFKDFIFCEDDISDFDDTVVHEPRTPGDNNPSRMIKLETYGGVMHYNFVPWEHVQAKQEWCRYNELVKNLNSARIIASRYKITEDDPTAKVSPIEAAWIEGYTIPVGLENVKSGWHLDAVRQMEQQYGEMFFLKLKIWKAFYKYLYVISRIILSYARDHGK